MKLKGFIDGVPIFDYEDDVDGSEYYPHIPDWLYYTVMSIMGLILTAEVLGFCIAMYRIATL